MTKIEKDSINKEAIIKPIIDEAKFEKRVDQKYGKITKKPI